MQDGFDRCSVSKDLFTYAVVFTRLERHRALICDSIWDCIDLGRHIYSLPIHTVLATISSPRNYTWSWCGVLILPSTSNSIHVFLQEKSVGCWYLRLR